MREPLRRDLGHALRALRRTPRFTASVVLALALGIGVTTPVLSLVRAGLTDAPAGVPLPDWRTGWTVEALTPAQLQLDGLHALLWILLALGLLLLALACINLTTLLLARGTARRREMAVRAALGAGPRQLARLQAIEGTVIALTGAGLGSGVAVAVTHLLRTTLPEGLPGGLEPALDGWMLAGTLGLCTLTTIAVAMIPVLGATRRNLHPALGTGRQVTAGRGEENARGALVIAQFAGTLILLVGAGLLLRGAAPTDRAGGAGFDASDTLTVQLDLSGQRHANPDQRAAFYGSLTDDLSALSSVRAASFASPGAWLGLGASDRVLAVCPECSTGSMWVPVVRGIARHHAVSPGYFSALGIPVRGGRGFATSDRTGAAKVAVVSETFGYRIFPRGDPLGKQIQLGGRDGAWYTVVGLVGDVQSRGLGTGSEPVPAVYTSALQHPPRIAGLAVRTAGDPLDSLPAVRAVVLEADPDVTVVGAMTMQQQLRRYMAPLRWFGGLFGGTAVVGSLLAAIGLGSVMSYTVARRTREMGIRMALGARAGQVMRLILGRSLRLTAIGAAIGLYGALILGRLLQVLFHGVRPLDPPVYGGVALLLVVVAMMASYRPARRATRMDPTAALRDE